MATILDTPRLILREFCLGDGGAMNRVFGDAEVMKYSNGVKTPQQVEAWIARWLDELYARWGFGGWAVVERDGGAVIGYCGLSRFPERCGDGDTEIGFRLARAYWGRGLATEAARGVRDYALGTLRLPRIVALIDPGNVASIRIAERIGMSYEREVTGMTIRIGFTC